MLAPLLIPVSLSDRPAEEIVGQVLGRDAGPVLIVCGPPAAGKTSLARALALGGRVHLDKDRFGDQLSPSIMAAVGGDPYDRDSDTYVRYGRALAYRILAVGAQREQARGNRVVVEAPFLTEVSDAARAGRTLSEHIAAEHGFGPADTLWLTASGPTRRERMRSRGARRDDAKLADWDAYTAAIPELPPPGTVDAVVRIDTLG